LQMAVPQQRMRPKLPLFRANGHNNGASGTGNANVECHTIPNYRRRCHPDPYWTVKLYPTGDLSPTAPTAASRSGVESGTTDARCSRYPHGSRSLGAGAPIL
jgi:hypothetical protein